MKRKRSWRYEVLLLLLLIVLIVLTGLVMDGRF